MDDLTQLKVRIMALESAQRKTDKFLKSVAKILKEPTVNDSLKKACKEFLDVFTGFTE